MTEIGMLYLILVGIAAVGFAGTLFWGMVATSPPTVGTHAQTELPEPFGAAHQKG